MTAAELIAEYRERSMQRNGGLYAIAVALLMNADATDRCAFWLKYLGTGDAATPMGALEALAAFHKEAVKDAAETIAEAIRDAAP